MGGKQPPWGGVERGVGLVSVLDHDGAVPVSSSGPGSSSGSAAGSLSVPVSVRRGGGPPGGPVRARAELTVESLARRASIESDSDEAVVAERLMARQRAASREHAVFLADLARLWVERDDPEVRDDREEMDLVAAIALRTTTSFAGSQLRDAHLALTDLPRTYAQLAAGAMPVERFTRLVVAVRALTQVQRDQVDQRVATWQLRSEEHTSELQSRG